MNAQNGRTVGIIGAGRLGQAMARVAIRAGRTVVLCEQPRPGIADLGRVRPRRGRLGAGRWTRRQWPAWS